MTILFGVRGYPNLLSNRSLQSVYCVRSETRTKSSTKTTGETQTMGKPTHLRWTLIPLIRSPSRRSPAQNPPGACGPSPTPDPKNPKTRRSPTRHPLRHDRGHQRPNETPGSRRRISHRKRRPGRHRLQMATHRRPRLLPDPPPEGRRTRHRNPLLHHRCPRNHDILKEDPSIPDPPHRNPRSYRRRPQRNLANRPTLRIRTNHLRRRRRAALRPLPQRRRLRRHAQRLPMVQVHL